VIPAVSAGVVVIIATFRYRRHRRMKDALHGAQL
jgi:hypothetical protein